MAGVGVFDFCCCVLQSVSLVVVVVVFCEVFLFWLVFEIFLSMQ
jgi:hypothetical protein